MANVRTMLGTVDITALNQDDKQQDYDFLAGTLGRESNEIRILADAGRFATQTGIPAGVFYAVMKLSGQTTLPGILSIDRARLHAILDRAVAAKIITADTVGQFPALSARFDQQVVQGVLTEQPAGVPANLAAILGLAIADPKVATQFLASYQTWDGDLAGFWKQVATQGTPLDAATVTKTQHAIQLGGITGYHPQMTAGLRAVMGYAPTLRDLLDWNEDDWTAFINQVGTKTRSSPYDRFRATRTRRSRQLRDDAGARVADAFPAAALSGRLARQASAVRASADVTHSSTQSDFDFARHPAYSLLDTSSPFADRRHGSEELPGGHEIGAAAVQMTRTIRRCARS